MSLAPQRAQERLQLYTVAQARYKITEALEQFKSEIHFLNELESFPAGFDREDVLERHQRWLDSLTKIDSDDPDIIEAQIAQALQDTTDIREQFQPSMLRAWIMLLAVLGCVVYLDTTASMTNKKRPLSLQPLLDRQVPYLPVSPDCCSKYINSPSAIPRSRNSPVLFERLD